MGETGTKTDGEGADELKAEVESLRHLCAQMEQSHERFRSDLARHVHDRLSQDAGVLEMALWLLSRGLPEKPEELRQEAAVALDAVKRIADSARQISARLRPGILDAKGLVAALEWRLRETEKREGARCLFINEGGAPALDRSKSTALFRSVEEALATLALNKPGASVSVRLCNGGRQAELSMTAQCGLATLASTEPTPSEMAPARERIRRLGGEFSFARSENQALMNIKIPTES